MTTNFPTSVDSFPDPSATDRLDNPPHDVLHTNVNSAVEAIETALLDGAPLHIDDTNERVGVGTTTPSTELEVDGTVTATEFVGHLQGPTHIQVKNTSGGSLSKGTPVYATGSVGASGAVEVQASLAGTASTMPALGLLDETLAHNDVGSATVIGVIRQVDTSSYSVNDELYVAVSGGLTATRPSGASELVQKIGRVVRSDASTGEILVLGAGRSNDVPNGLSPTITLAGDASGSVTLTELGSGTLTVTVADNSHSHSYLPLTGGTLTGDTTYSQTGRYIKLGAWTNDGNWAAVDGANGYLLLDGNYADDDIYLRSYNNSGRVNIGAGNSNTLGVDNGSITVSGVGYATNWSVGTGSSANAFVGGSNYWRPQDAYGNSYFDINSGSFYVDSPTYYFRNSSSQNIMTMNNSKETVMYGHVVSAYNATPSNYYNQLQFEAQATSGTAGIGLHRSGYSHCGIYHDAINSLKFSMNNGTVTLLNDAGTLYGSGNSNNYNTDWYANKSFADNWFRSIGDTGWYNETHQGGIYMTDATWVRTYNSKGLHTPTHMDASGYVYAGDQFRAFKYLSQTNGAWNYTQAHIRLDRNNSALAISGHPHGGHANQFVWSTGSGTIYVRNWNNTGYAAIEGTIYNTSHSKYKKNITPLRAKSVGAAASKTVLADTLKKIELVEYELKPESSDAGLIPDRWETTVWDDELEREVNVPNERRQKALARLNEFREASGLEQYNRIHECGKDCDYTPENPCKITRNASMRIPGFLAEQAVEHIPGVITVNDEGEGHSVSLIALSGFLMGVVQELVERVDDLEAAS